MEHGFEVTTKHGLDGTIIQEVYSVRNDIREQIMQRVMNTQEQQIKDALIKLGWTPPNVK